jgi:hypothetical protein
MIVFNDFIKARFGNQLFFVASTMGIATKNNTEYAFTSDMGHSGINYQSIFKNSLPKTTYIPEKKYYQEQFCYYDVILNEDTEIIGYFQSEKYFKHIESLVRKQFEFKDEIIDFVKSKHPNISESCTIHIRRGDYISQPNHHPLIPIEYYTNYINNYSEGNIYIFSDDIEWAKEQFIGDRYIFPFFEQDNDLNCFVLMSLSKNSLIANSTYSWWAAWLNQNPNKKIYTPDHTKWFGISYNNLDTKDLIPDSWTQIKFN